MPIALRSERRYDTNAGHKWWQCLGLTRVNQRLKAESFLSSRLRWVATHQVGQARIVSSLNEEIKEFTIPVIDAFKTAARTYPSISVDTEVMGGAPCIAGTRIPVYMILDALEYHGTLQAAIESYPRLTTQQVKDAIGFTKLVVECPVEHETPPAS